MLTSPFSVGKPLSVGHVNGRRRELLGFITESSVQKLGLNLSQPMPPSFFERGTAVRVGFWDQNQLFRWDTEIQQVSGPVGQSLVVSKPTQAPVVDRRQYRRFPLNIPLFFQIIYASNRRLASPVLLEGMTQYLSLGGLSFETDVSLKGGDIVELELDISAPEPVRAFSRVVRSQQGSVQQESSNLVALQFLRLSRKEHERLQQLLPQAG